LLTTGNTKRAVRIVATTGRISATRGEDFNRGF